MRDDVVEYLSDYARRYDLRVELDSRVRREPRRPQRHMGDRLSD
jgi:hypothetical protein